MFMELKVSMVQPHCVDKGVLASSHIMYMYTSHLIVTGVPNPCTVVGLPSQQTKKRRNGNRKQQQGLKGRIYMYGYHTACYVVYVYGTQW